MKPIKKRRVDIMLVLKDHEGRLQRIEALLNAVALEAKADRDRLVLPATDQQTAIITKG